MRMDNCCREQRGVAVSEADQAAGDGVIDLLEELARLVDPGFGGHWIPVSAAQVRRGEQRPNAPHTGVRLAVASRARVAHCSPSPSTAW